MKLTIFTPTYNRAYRLSRLYESLCEQTNKDFQWLIIDDGSSDNTKQIVEKWEREGLIAIRYEYQKNAGKSMAHNVGVRLAESEYFVCVDSDDWLSSNAVEVVLTNVAALSARNTGLLMPRLFNGHKISSTVMPEVEETTLYDAYERYGMRGDTMLVFKTDILKRFEFPYIEGEKFVPETFLYNLVDSVGTLKVVRECVYNCEYLEDGYTNNVYILLRNNPKGYIACINQTLSLMDKTPWTKFKDSARYVSMMLFLNPQRILKDAVYPLYALFAFPVGLIAYWKRYKNK